MLDLFFSSEIQKIWQVCVSKSFWFLDMLCNCSAIADRCEKRSAIQDFHCIGFEPISNLNRFRASYELRIHMKYSSSVETPRVLTTPSRPCNLDRETTVNHGGTRSVEKCFSTFKLTRKSCYSPKQSRQNTLNYRASIFGKVTTHCKFRKVRTMNSQKLIFERHEFLSMIWDFSILQLNYRSALTNSKKRVFSKPLWSLRKCFDINF